MGEADGAEEELTRDWTSNGYYGFPRLFRRYRNALRERVGREGGCPGSGPAGADTGHRERCARPSNQEGYTEVRIMRGLRKPYRYRCALILF